MSETTNRRTFLGASLGAALAAGALARHALSAPDEKPAAPKAGKKLKLLILGGTSFLGPAVVDRALARGHTVTLFNRGKTNPGLYPELEKLRGNRGEPPNRRRKDGVPTDLLALEGRKWDAVVDTSCLWPIQATETATLLKDAVRHYTFISSISVYPGFGKSNTTITEDTPTEVKPRAEYETWNYGAFKAIAEANCERIMPGRVANIRPGLIVGPRDATNRFAYWPMRVRRGGEVLAPGNPEGHFQVIDVRDLGNWIIHCIEADITGVYNAVGFKGHLSFQEFLHGCKCAIRTDCTFTWVDEAFLEAQKVRPWMDLPVWMPEKVLPYVNVERALAGGLVLRPVAETIRDTIDWEVNERKGKLRVQLTPDREAAVLRAWHESQKSVPAAPADDK